MDEQSTKISLSGAKEALSKRFKNEESKTAADCVVVGMWLLVLKDCVATGTFKDKANELGLHADIARRYMACATRFGNQAPTFFEAVRTPSNLMALLPLDEDEVECLAKGEEVFGLTLERLKTMTVLELRHALRAGRQEQEKLRNDAFTSKLEARGIVPNTKPTEPAPVRLSIDEELMLRNYRKCSAEGKAHVTQAAKLLAIKAP